MAMALQLTMMASQFVKDRVFIRVTCPYKRKVLIGSVSHGRKIEYPIDFRPGNGFLCALAVWVKS